MKLPWRSPKPEAVPEEVAANSAPNGVVPGADEWVENGLYCTYYREQGPWCAHIGPARGGWDVDVWLYRYGPEHPDSRVAHEHVTGTADRAKWFADAMLAERTGGREEENPAPGEDQQ